MATEKSTRVTNATSSPRVVNGQNCGRVIRVHDTMEVADGANGDVAILACRVPVDAQITRVVFASDDLVGDATASIGFYRQDNPPHGTTFTEVDKDIIANDIDVNDAAVAPTDYRYSALAIETIDDPAWSLAGLSARPDYSHLFVAVTFETDTEATGTVALAVEYMGT